MNRDRNVPPRSPNGGINVVIETPRGATGKFKFDEATGLFRLSRPLPAGITYPFDWGFVPGTRAADGDPLDAMVIWDGGSYPGVLIACRPLGAITVDQTSRVHGGRERNDRLLVRPLNAPRQDAVRGVTDLSPRTREELEHFFKAVVAFQGKDLAILGWASAADADNLLVTCEASDGGRLRAAPGDR
jgi:inorganic pyrophosphatase